MRFLQEALAEVRRRTHEVMTPPAEEEVSVQTVMSRPGNLAFSGYLGGYRSQIEFNLDVPLGLSRVLEIMSHEGYPGHHVEAVLKEQELYQARGYVEHSLDLLIAPQAVISEGLAMLAPSMIFTPDEEQAWLAEYVYPVAGVEPLAAGWEYVRQMPGWSMDVQGNAAFLLREGRPDQEVMQYLMRHLMVTEEQAQPMLVYLKAPFNTAHIFSYTAGKRLLLAEGRVAGAQQTEYDRSEDEQDRADNGAEREPPCCLRGSVRRRLGEPFANEYWRGCIVVGITG